MLAVMLATLVLQMTSATPNSDARTTVPLEVVQLSLATLTDETEVPYYSCELPIVAVPSGRKLAEAYLEFNLDVANANEEMPDSTVTLEVHSYTGLTNGLLDVEGLGTSSMKRTVKIGNNRAVRVYVTDLLAETLVNPERERQVIIGSVSGKRVGRFNANNLPAAGGAKAVLIVHFQRVDELIAPLNE